MSYDHAFYNCYLADAGASVYYENRQCYQAKDHRKYSEDFLTRLLETIVSRKEKPRIHSVDTFVHTYRKEYPNESVPCTKTVCILIDRGVLSVRYIDFLMKMRIRLRRKRRSDPNGTNAKYVGRSIEERDSSILLREVTGHWEIDSVLGKKRKGERVLITMIKGKQGLEYFRSLTTDNGS